MRFAWDLTWRENKARKMERKSSQKEKNLIRWRKKKLLVENLFQGGKFLGKWGQKSGKVKWKIRFDTKKKKRRGLWSHWSERFLFFFPVGS